MATYLTHPTFDFLPIGAAGISPHGEPYIIGEVVTTRDKFLDKTPYYHFEATFRLDGISDVADLRDFFDARKGAFDAFWLRSWVSSIKLASAASSSATTLTVTDNGELTLLDNNRIQHIYIPTLDSRHEVTEVAANGDNIDLTIDPAISGDLANGDGAELLFLVRFSSDDCEIQSVADQPNVFTVSFGFKELQGETPNAS